MVKKFLLGCLALVALAIAGVVVMLSLTWNTSTGDSARGTATNEQSLGRILDTAFSSTPDVEFVCSFPVVGVAPCVFNSDIGDREVKLTFTDYTAPEGTTLDDQARLIALLARGNSAFAGLSGSIQVIFETGSESALVSRQYEFTPAQLATEDSPSLEPPTE